MTQEGTAPATRSTPVAFLAGIAYSRDSLISDGCVVFGGTTIDRSVLGVRARIGERCQIIETVIIGADRVETDEERAANERRNIPSFNVGNNCHIEKAILDKDCRIGNNVTINYRGKDINVDGKNYYIRDGIVVIPKGTVVPDGTVI